MSVFAEAAEAPRFIEAALPAGRPGANLARFWERRGERVFEMHGVIWGHKKGPFFTSLPFHLAVDLEPEHVAEVLRKSRVLGLQFPVRRGGGLMSGLYVCDSAEYSLQSVSRKQRGHVRQGLENCEIRRIDGDELASQGLALNRETLGRHGRSEATFLDPVKWRGFAEAVADSSGMMAWGAFFKGRLSSYIIGCRDGDWLHLMHKASRTADLAQCINHGLDFCIANAAAGAGVRMISNGGSALMPNEGLDRYKRQMGYTLLEQRHAVHFHPALAGMLGGAIPAAISRAGSDWLPGNKKLFYMSRMMEGARMTREPEESACQQEDPRFSRLVRPGGLFPILRVTQTFRQGGIGNTARRTADYLSRKFHKGGTKVIRGYTPEESLGLQPGEWVQVKSAEEIRATLDARKKSRGLLFTDDMARFAGQRLRVHKRVESIFLEESKQQRKIKNTVLLESAFCSGKSFNCDRSCFLFWKEVWLRRV